MGATEIAPSGLDDMAARIAAERPRLVRLCTAITRDPLAAEDLAHETLFEALRRRERLHDPAGLALWLNAIARHVCARWQRYSSREQANAAHDEAAAHAVPDGWDIEIELERHELATLLDRALALLPPETRAVLVARYIEETPHAAIADRLGMSEGAVAMRLQRGKIALRRVLGNQLRHEATAYGLDEPQSGPIQTGIWCPFCGRQRLMRDANAAHEREHFYCPACAFGEQRTVSSLFSPSLLGDLRSPKAILSRQIDWLHRYYRSALENRQSACVVCGQPMVVKLGMPERHEARLVGGHGMMLRCSASNHFDNCQPLQYLVLDIPAVQQFWRQHPRMRLAYQHEMRFGERDAALIMFERSDGSARIEVVSALDSFEVLAVEQTV